MTLQSGQQLLLQGDFEAAAELFEKALASEPASSEAAAGLGRSLMSLGRPTQAVGYLSKAASLDPSNHGLLRDLAVCQSRLGNLDAALLLMRSAIDLKPDWVEALVQLGHALLLKEQTEEALIYLRRAASLDPNDAPARDWLACALRQAGALEEATSHSLEAVNLDPKNWIYLCRLVLGAKVTDPSLMDRLQSLARSGPPRRQVHVNFALGKGFEDLGRFEESSRHFLLANRLALTESAPFDPAAHRQEIDFIVENSSFEQFGIRPNPSGKPVLVVGMMRSGTTLTEQILSCHPQVAAAGEQGFWRDNGPRLHVELVRSGNPVRLEAAAGEYLSRLSSGRENAPKVVDKLPQNYLMLGLVLAALPQAKVVHVRRDPRDTCLSIFTTPFSFPPAFAHDPALIGSVYEQYLRIMEFWRAQLSPERLLEIDYEDLVLDRESATRRLLTFLNLEWNNACLYPERNRRAIANPSQWQARQPVFDSSIGRWRRFMPWLEEPIRHWTFETCAN